ncbi:MAG: alpha/beta hydrolase [Phycisphaera sp.]|nr:alpha/beta hydrolase [Phycisphaera sp.]
MSVILLTSLMAIGAAHAASPDAIDAAASKHAVAQLEAYLKSPRAERPAIAGQAFTQTPLTRADAERAQQLLWDDHVAIIRATRADEMKARRLTDSEHVMPFFYSVTGDKPVSGRSLYISMHGGGNAPPRVNDQQWENQKRLYKVPEGVYVAPRAPTNTWNLWHEPHIDVLFDRLIEDLIVFEEVDPNRVYIMGYSAGGDGVYQLAPRMADRFAAASMMAGHPNDASPLGLRNLPFSIHVGANDGGYKRNEVAAQWGEKLDALHDADPDGYVHWVTLYAGKGHWMDREDAAAVPWMAKFTRNPTPDRVVWRQQRHTRFYWLACDTPEKGAVVRATRSGQTIDLAAEGVTQITVRLNDHMLDLDRDVTVTTAGRPIYAGRASRTIGVIDKTLAERGDPASVFSAEIVVPLPAASK